METPELPSRPPFNPLDLTNRRVLVTGASSGIGRATAVYISRLGASVIVSGRDISRLQETATALAGAGHAIEPFDLVDVEAIPAWLRAVANRNGPLNGLVHSAGVHLAAPVSVVSLATADEVFRINVTAALALAKGMRLKAVSSGARSIVFISSVVAAVGQAGVSVYAASKGGVLSLTKSLALEFARENIRVNCLLPGYVETELTSRFRARLTAAQFEAIAQRHPLGLGKPEDIAALVAFLISDASRWMTGAAVFIDGGYTAG